MKNHEKKVKSNGFTYWHRGVNGELGVFTIALPTRDLGLNWQAKEWSQLSCLGFTLIFYYILKY